jgi:hypothetical protein
MCFGGTGARDRRTPMWSPILAGREAKRLSVAMMSAPMLAWSDHARPLRRIVQEPIGDALVERLLRGEAGSGQTVRVDAGDAGLRFEAATPEAAP